jgi:predicted nucleic acid-binding protein
MSSPRIAVPDSSVLLKWVLESTDEQDRDKAMELRDAWLSGALTIVVPSLWYFEVGNVLGMKQPGLATQFMEILTEYRFEEEPAANIYKKAFDLMKKFNVTFYDAAFHSVAITRSGTMITADDVYYRKTSHAGHISLLRDWNFE